MPGRGFQIVYFVLLPVIVTAACILGYFSWRTAETYNELGQQTIAQATLEQVREKIEAMERTLIEMDNRVFRMLRFDDLKNSEDEWATRAREVSPSVRAVAVLDEKFRRVALRVRGSEKDKWDFWSVLRDKALPELTSDLEKLAPGKLKHLHATYGTRNFLFSYQTFVHSDRTLYVFLHHDTGFIVRETLPNLLRSDAEARVYNVIDEESGRRVYGDSLENSGDFVLGTRFPTTLYRWRLQAAPEQAPLLEQQSKVQKRNEMAFVAIALAIIILGIITILFAANRERRFNALKSDFIANVSHELKTPLSVIRMFSEMLATGRVPDEDKEMQYLDIISRESERLSALIENVLDFAALERGKQKYQLERGDLKSAVQRAVDSFRYRMEKDGVQVEIQAPPDPLLVDMDEQAVLLAIINLLDNAAKYGSGSPIHVCLEVHGSKAEIHVKDRGPGIPREDLKRIFDRFYRSKGRETARGSGIGLSLVKHIAEEHGGAAWAENQADGGALVAFSVPLAIVGT